MMKIEVSSKVCDVENVSLTVRLSYCSLVSSLLAGHCLSCSRHAAAGHHPPADRLLGRSDQRGAGAGDRSQSTSGSSSVSYKVLANKVRGL